MQIYRKACLSLENQLNRYSRKIQYIFFISLIIYQACSVLKRKRIGLIPVQATAQSRRMFKMRGRAPALQGRPRNSQRLAVQLTVGDEQEDDDGVVRHKLPTLKQRNRTSHSLVSATESNKRASKKH